ncbi:MAG: multicopper oxidase domain-containing protein [Thermoplasmatota archaeon]
MHAIPSLLCGLLLGALFSGCAAPDISDPYATVPATGHTVHLKMGVVDLLGSQIFPGFNANLWAFCAEAADPTDAYSVAAVEYWNPLPTDAQALNDPNHHCSVPGPTLRVHQGDHVVVDFCNTHFHGHTIHWHGQFVPNDADGAPGVTQGIVQSGECYTYDFMATKAGTLWYHCHVDTQLHIMQGLYGLFIVDPPAAREPKDARNIPPDHEYYLVQGGQRRD